MRKKPHLNMEYQWFVLLLLRPIHKLFVESCFLLQDTCRTSGFNCGSNCTVLPWLFKKTKQKKNITYTHWQYWSPPTQCYLYSRVYRAVPQSCSYIWLSFFGFINLCYTLLLVTSHILYNLNQQCDTTCVLKQ